MIPSFDFVLVAIFIPVQWCITLRLLRFAGRRLLARAVVFLLDALLAVGLVFNFSDLFGRLEMGGTVFTLIGGVTLVYLLSSLAVATVWMAMRAVRKHLDADVNPGRRRALNTAGGLLMGAPFAVLGYGALVQRTDFRVRELDVPLHGLPEDLDGLRVLQLSDIHLSAFLSEAELARVIDASLELRPHLAVVTGDLISQRGDPLDACIRQLARVKADAGVFGCLGNHERFAHVERYATEAAARVGIRFLRGAAQPLRFGNAVLNLAGVDYQSKSDRRPYLRGAERLVVPGAVNLLLSHNPDVFPIAARQGYNCVLAGHTHGGQITVEILDESINPARFFTPFVYGLYRVGKSAAYVTRGIGTIGIPARIGAPPEISVLRLRKA